MRAEDLYCLCRLSYMMNNYIITKLVNKVWVLYLSLFLIFTESNKLLIRKSNKKFKSLCLLIYFNISLFKLFEKIRLAIGAEQLLRNKSM